MNEFSQSLINVLEDLTPDGGAGRQYSELTKDQREIVDEMLGEEQSRDLYDGLLMAGKAINQLNKVVGGFTSEDISIEYNPVTGQSNWRVKPKENIAGGAADLGTAEKERMCYQRLDDEDGDPVYGWDFVRSVAATEA